MTEIALDLPVLSDEDQALLDATKDTFNQIVVRVKDFVIVDDPALGTATDMVKSLKMGIKTLEARRKELVDPWNERVKQVNNAFKGLQREADLAIKTLGGQMTQYHLQVEAKLRAEEEARRKHEAELLKAQEDELREKATLEGQDIEAEMEKVQERQSELAGPITKAPKSVSHGTVASSSVRKTWAFNLNDITKVPARYLQLNEVAVRAAIGSGVRNITGLEIYQKSTTVVR